MKINSKKTILLISIGSRGDINPFITLGIALKNRGHDVVVISLDIYKQLAENAELKFIPIGSSEIYHQIIKNQDIVHPRKGFELIIQHLILGTINETFKIIANFNPKNTIIAAGPYIVGARIAQEKLKFPLVSICLQPAVFWSAESPAHVSGYSLISLLPKFARNFFLNIIDRFYFDRLLSPAINHFRNELGLPAIKHIYSQWLLSPQCVIGLFPDWFAKPAEDWPKQTCLTGFLGHTDNNQPLSEKILDFIHSGKPPLAFTCGTSMTHGKEFFKTSIEAAKKLNCRALLLTQFPEQLENPLPKDFLQVNYAPFNQLLPHVSAFIHHGGIGTVAQALAVGVPQLIVPVTHDQPDNAYHVQKLQVGLTIHPRDYKSDHIENKISQLLTSDRIKENCMAYGKKIDFRQSELAACALIENIHAHAFIAQ